MFYRTDAGQGHPLPHNPFKALVSPRPIAWVSSQDKQGRDNLAPYSFFNGVSETPPILGFSAGPKKLGSDAPKDTRMNIIETGHFCISVVGYAMRDAMNKTTAHYEHGVDEFEKAGLTKGAPQCQPVPYVADAPAAFECKLLSVTELPGGYAWVMGEVLGIHINDQVMVDGLVDVTAYQPLARLGYRDYAKVSEVFSLSRPNED